VLLNEGDPAPRRAPPGRPAARRAAPPPAPANRFDTALARHGLPALRRAQVKTLQVNLGKACNQACLHCHVDAGPQRSERMEARTAERVLQVLRRSPDVAALDLTGGEPELNPHFRRLVNGALAAGKEVSVRTNLTVLLLPAQADTPLFLAQRGVTVIASLPCYTADNVDRQRGAGAFEGSLRALRTLNGLGYGRLQGAEAPDDAEDDDEAETPAVLRLHLVHNPLGPSLPPPQAALEADYRQRLRDDHGVVFDRLFTLANMPIARFAEDLLRTGRLEEYESLLEQRFNAAAVPGLMCRELVSVDWDGRLSDCDFNQMLGLPAGAGARTIFDVDDLSALDRRPVRTGSHCLGCSAGQGSSCGGALTG
jgi:radical SAM/Cys-rich protein